MENEGPIENSTLDELKQELEKYELELKEIYLQISATMLPTPEQIQNWDCLKEAKRIHIEKLTNRSKNSKIRQPSFANTLRQSQEESVV